MLLRHWPAMQNWQRAFCRSMTRLQQRMSWILSMKRWGLYLLRYWRMPAYTSVRRKEERHFSSSLRLYKGTGNGIIGNIIWAIMSRNVCNCPFFPYYGHSQFCSFFAHFCKNIENKKELWHNIVGKLAVWVVSI